MHRSQRFLRLASLSFVGLLAIVSLSAAVGCGSAEAKPIDVTYYYLPG